PPDNLDLLLGLTGTRHYFAAVVTGDDVKRGKPDPEVFLTAAAKLGAEPSRCVVFEDAVAGGEAARPRGMRSVAVTFVSHHPVEKLRAAGADVIVASLDELSPEQVAALVPSGGAA